MARGSKKKYTSKQKRKARDIEKGYKKRGVSSEEAERCAWATVNKSDKGGRKKAAEVAGNKAAEFRSANAPEPPRIGRTCLWRLKRDVRTAKTRMCSEQ